MHRTISPRRSTVKTRMFHARRRMGEILEAPMTCRAMQLPEPGLPLHLASVLI
jgi:hypothetical protein